MNKPKMKWAVRSIEDGEHASSVVDESGQSIVPDLSWSAALHIVQAHNASFLDDKATSHLHYTLWTEKGVGLPYCSVHESGHNNEDIVLSAFGKEIKFHPAQIEFFINALTELTYDRAQRRTQQLTKN